MWIKTEVSKLKKNIHNFGEKSQGWRGRVWQRTHIAILVIPTLITVILDTYILPSTQNRDPGSLTVHPPPPIMIFGQNICSN